MQKVINAMAVLSFAVSSGVVAAGVVLYNSQDKIVDGIKQRVVEGVSEALPEMLTGALGGMQMGEDLAPSLPSTPDTDKFGPGF